MTFNLPQYNNIKQLRYRKPFYQTKAILQLRCFIIVLQNSKITINLN